MQTMEKDQNKMNRPLRFVPSFASAFYPRRGVGIEALRSPDFLVFYVIACLIFVLHVDEAAYRVGAESLAYSKVAGIQLVACLLCLFWIAFAVLVGMALHYKGWIRAVHLTPIYMPIALIIQQKYAFVQYTFGEEPWKLVPLQQQFFEDLALLLMMETFFASFVVAKMSNVFVSDKQVLRRREAEGSEADLPTGDTEPKERSLAVDGDPENEIADGDVIKPGEPPKPLLGKTLVINTKDGNIPLREITLVRSEGHYLRYVTKNGETLTRQTMKSLCDEVPSEIGQQINRSVWVPFHAVRKVHTNNSDLSLELRNGAVQIVSRARRISVRNSLEAFEASIKVTEPKE